MEKSLFRKYLERYFSPELPTKLVFFNLIVTAGICGCLITLFLSLLTDMPLSRHILTVVCLALLFFTGKLANEGGDLGAVSLVLSVLLSFALVPIMYFIGGGTAGGVHLWMALGLIVTFVLLAGRVRKYLLLAEAVAYTALLVISYQQPELVPHYYTRAGSYLEIWQGIFIVSFVAGLVLYWQTSIYHRTMERYARQNESLNASKKEAEDAQAEAIAANKAKSHFLASLSHEIRVPINTVLRMDELILRQTKDREVAQYAVDLREAGQRLLNLLNDILDFSSLESGRMELSETDYHLEEILHDAVSMISPGMKRKGLAFKLKCDGQLPSGLHGDSIRIRQILINLLVNAVKYTAEGSVELFAGCRRIDGDRIELILSVKDTGVGISSENKQRIYESFQRLEGENSRHIQGIGIGLPIVKQLLDLMHGIIKVDSVYGKGSTFTVEIPQAVNNWAPVGDVMGVLNRINEDNEKYKERFKAPRARILMVDDMPANFAYIKELIRPTEVQVDTAQSGQECLNMLQRKRYHLIFMDHLMPEMDGVETLKRMKTLVGNRNMEVPVVIVTARTAAGLREKFISLGFSDCLSKPVRGVELEDMLMKFLPAGMVNLIDAPRKEPVPAVAGASGPEAVPLNLKDPVDRTGRDREAVPEEFWPLLDILPALDVATGLGYCAGDPALYRQALTDYCANDRLLELEKCHGAGDLENYRVNLTALKDASLTIGHTGLSDAVKALETAAKENNIAFIGYCHAAAMGVYEDLLGKLRQFLQGSEGSAENPVRGKLPPQAKLILVVDEEEDSRRLVRRALQGSHYVGEAANTKAAFDFIEDESPDLILLSISLKDSMDGREFLNQLLMDPRWKKIPVIVLTPAEDTEAELWALRMGAKDVLTKPLAEELVRHRVRTIIELSGLSSDMDNKVAAATEKLAGRSEAAEDLARQALEAMACTADATDKYQQGHAFRVARLAKEIGSRLGQPEREQQRLYYLGMVYDVGKASISPELLQKKGKLTEEERSVVQRHAVLGEELLKRVTGKPEFAQAARWHHERYDGTGYPDGLKGTEIPLFARIIAGADAWDAMGAQRAYREPLSLPEIRAEFIRERGGQFDPAVAEVIVKMIENDPVYEGEAASR